MRLIFPLLIWFVVSVFSGKKSFGKVIGIGIYEDFPNSGFNLETVFYLDLENLKIEPESKIYGDSIPKTSVYRISNRLIIKDSIVIGPGDDLLYQCNLNSLDVLIIRKEYNSFSNPIRILMAISGHPVQVSEIRIVVRNEKTNLMEEVLRRKKNAYNWYAKVVSKP